jgi:hypothetical protein
VARQGTLQKGVDPSAKKPSFATWSAKTSSWCSLAFQRYVHLDQTERVRAQAEVSNGSK